MSSREKILKEIAQNKPHEAALPGKFMAGTTYENVSQKFLEVLRSIGGQGDIIENWSQPETLLQQGLQEGIEVVSDIEALSLYNSKAYQYKTAIEVEDVHTVFVKGRLAVAENGSVWLPESRMINRMLPFICQQLVIVVDENSLVSNMHQAYDRITINEEGYGAFIAGPSKTADIEQSLVIGAHGPLGLYVFILKEGSFI